MGRNNEVIGNILEGLSRKNKLNEDADGVKVIREPGKSPVYKYKGYTAKFVKTYQMYMVYKGSKLIASMPRRSRDESTEQSLKNYVDKGAKESIDDLDDLVGEAKTWNVMFKTDSDREGSYLVIQAGSDAEAFKRTREIVQDKSIQIQGLLTKSGTKYVKKFQLNR